MHEQDLDSHPDQRNQEVTIVVLHGDTLGKCSLELTEISITFNPNSYGSLNSDPRTHCPECDRALI